LHIERYYSPELRPFGELSKPKSIKNKKHILWIREQPCVVSGIEGPTIVAHHVHRKAQGVNDLLTVPLDSSIHNELHTSGVKTFQDQHRVNLDHALIAKLVERILYLEKQMGG